jgi:type II secretory pathway pseudopilin PulG
LKPLEAHVTGLIVEQQRAEEEQASQQSLKAIQKAFHEAMLALPREEYDWFDVQGRSRQEGGNTKNPATDGPPAGDDGDEFLSGVSASKPSATLQRQFFDYAGALFSVVASPASSTIALNQSRKFRALPRDRSRRRVVEDMQFAWEIVEGEGSLGGVTDQEVEYQAPAVPGLARLKVTVSQREVTVGAEALITVTDSLESGITPVVVNARGLPGYTFERAAGELWRCRFDIERNIIVVNSGHRDFVFATRSRALQLRYLVRLYVKELVLKNFAGLPADQLLERMIELSLYAEEKLKSS